MRGLSTLVSSWKGASIALALMIATASQSSAAVITYTGKTVDEQGTGFGNILVVLSVSEKPPDLKDLEFGSVLWNGSKDVLSGTAGNQSTTRTAGELMSVGIDGESPFGLILNINEPGNAKGITVKDFFLAFQKADGGLLFNALFDAPPPGPLGSLNLIQVGNGQGASGHLFEVTLTDSERAAFFGDLNNRLGQVITIPNAITNVSGGAENFYVAAVRKDQPGVIPEPSSMLLFLTAVGGGIAIWGWRRKSGKAVAV